MSSAVAKIILRDADDKILVLRRSSTHPYHAFHLDFPGGEVEPHETPLEGVWRELIEEAGLTIDKDAIELLHEAEHEPGTSYLVYTARMNESQPEVIISWGHDQYEWLHEHELLARELPAGIDSYYQMVISYLLKSTQISSS